MFGQFYEDFEKKRKEGLYYQLVYFLRRDIYIGIAFILAN